MTPYWLLFTLPLIGLLMPFRMNAAARRATLLAYALLLALVIGLRHQVGGDWGNYLAIYDELTSSDFFDVTIDAPAYGFLNQLAGVLGLGIHGVNLTCGAIFVTGFMAFARRQPLPWLAWVVVTPYVLIVVVMGYSRQGVALGILFWGLSLLEQRRTWSFLFLVVLAALFHKAATLAAPLAFLLRERRGWLQTLALVLALVAAVVGLFAASFESLWRNYVEDPMVSEGAGVRVWMNALPAALMLLMARRWNRRWPDPGYWRYIALASIGCVFLVGAASTAVDRVALYLTPIQVYVWCRFPLLFRTPSDRTAVVLGICGVYGAVLWVWLNFAVHAFAWLPYRSILFE